MQEQKKALWKQFVNRFEVLKEKAQSTYPNGKPWEDILAEMLQNEYNLTVK